MASTSVPPSVPPPAAEVLRAEMERDPDIWLRVLGWCVVAFSVTQVLLFSFGRDHGCIATVAAGLLRGDMPYRDLWDDRPPGIYYVFASAFALFGHYMAAPRVLEALAMVGVALSCRRLGGVFFASRTAGLMGGACACLIHAQLEFHNTAQPGTYAGALCLFALVTTTHPWPRKHARWAWSLVGLLVGFMGLLEPALLGTSMAFGLYLFLHRRKDGYGPWAQLAPLLTILAAAFLVPLATLLWFSARGALPELLWTLGPYSLRSSAGAWAEQSAPHLLYDTLQKALFNQSALLAAGLISAAAVHPRARREKEAFLFFFGIITIQLTGVAFRATFQAHDFAASLPLLGLLAGVGLFKLWRRIGPGSWAGTAAFAALLLVLPLMRGPGRDLPQSFWERSRLRLTYLLGAGRFITREELDRSLDRHDGFQLATLHAVSNNVMRLVPAGRTIHVAGHEPIIYFLAERSPASRFLWNPNDKLEPHLAQVDAEIASALARHPPDAVVAIDGHSSDVAPVADLLRQGWSLHRTEDGYAILTSPSAATTPPP